ncbi:MAG: O-antigen ligase family protein [Candidatus Moranbacteria bacterium]|nr:O-antigen ligase family protein [Candidatus Moranbacteria bacterium]
MKIFFTLSFALTGLVFFWTYSYAAWFSVFFSIIIVSAFYQSRKHFLKTFFIITVLLFLVLFFQINTQKFSDLTNHPEKSSLASRIMIWNVAEKLALENPISGIGPGNFQKEYLAAQPSFPPYLEWAVPQPHNLFLAFWLQTGLIGLFGFVFLACNIFIFLLKKENKNSLDWVLFSFLLYTLIHGLVDTPFWKNDLSFLFWFFIAFFLLIKQKEKDFQK